MKTVIAIVAAASIFVPTAALSWGEDGHSIVAEIAQHRLTPEAEAAVQALLKSEYRQNFKGRLSLASIASWADDYREGHAETSNWHFVDIPVNLAGTKPEDVRYDRTRDCPPASDPKGTCLVDALKSEVDILSRPALASDANAIAERLKALKFVVHLMGDLAQPLHCADRDHDAGGNELHVFYSGPHHPPGEVHTNFHRVWDIDILTDGHYDWGDYNSHLERDWLDGKDEASIATGDFEAWANECHQKALVAYTLVPFDLTLSKTQLTAELTVADEQLAKAGVRLAAILNKALGGGN
jgi:hypothetical protein